MIFFLYGHDSYRSKEKLEQIKTKFKNEIDEKGFNIITLTGDDFDLEKFNSAAVQSGFLTSKRLIIVKNLLLSKPNKDLADQLLELLKKLKATDNIFIFYEAGLPDKRSAMFKFLNKDKKLSQIFEALTGKALTDWLKKYVQDQGGQIQISALNLLIASIGNDLWQLTNELNKLIAFKNQEEIKEQDVREFVSVKITENVFGLTEAIAAGNRPQALKLLDEQLKSGLNGIYLLTMIVRQFRIVAQLKSLLSQNLSPAQVTQASGLHPYVVKKTLPLAKKFPAAKIQTIYQKLAELDKQFKSTSLPPETLMDLLIMEI